MDLQWHGKFDAKGKKFLPTLRQWWCYLYAGEYLALAEQAHYSTVLEFLWITVRKEVAFNCLPYQEDSSIKIMVKVPLLCSDFNYTWILKKMLNQYANLFFQDPMIIKGSEGGPKCHWCRRCMNGTRTQSCITREWWLCLSAAPRSFTMLLRPRGSILRVFEIRLLIYLDDILIAAPSEEAPLDHIKATIHLLKALGFVIKEWKNQSFHFKNQ